MEKSVPVHSGVPKMQQVEILVSCVELQGKNCVSAHRSNR